MERAEFVKRGWKAYETILLTEPRDGQVKEMLLISVDFDKEQLELFPLNANYQQMSVFVHIKFCSIPPPKLKIRK